jgi:small subunit ribosomal protein S9
MTEEPQQPEGEAPEDETPEGAPGEPGEATPSEAAPGEPGEATPSETAPDAEESAPQADEAPAAPEAPGPEIEGLEELGRASADAGDEAPEAEPPAEEPPAEEPPAERPRGRRGGKGDQEEVIPGAHLEPDLVLEEQRPEGEYGEYDQFAEADAGAYQEGEGDAAGEPAPVAHTPLELAADARYNATGKRKSAIARVILKPGEGTYTINGRHLDEYFPRIRLQRMATQPLEAAGYHTRMDVVARIHGGGVSAQANALRHGIARALVEADPALRTEMKRRGYLTRDPREKERKKAGLKKARKRPQFSKR